jgi:hypothetical protein
MPCERPSSRTASEAGEMLSSLRSKPKPRSKTLHRVAGSLAGAVLSLAKNRRPKSRGKRVAGRKYTGR